MSFLNELQACKDLSLELGRVEHAAMRPCRKPGDAIAQGVVKEVAVVGIQEEVVPCVDHRDVGIAAKNVLDFFHLDMLGGTLNVAREVVARGNGRVPPPVTHETSSGRVVTRKAATIKRASFSEMSGGELNWILFQTRSRGVTSTNFSSICSRDQDFDSSMKDSTVEVT